MRPYTILMTQEFERNYIGQYQNFSPYIEYRAASKEILKNIQTICMKEIKIAHASFPKTSRGGKVSRTLKRIEITCGIEDKAKFLESLTSLYKPKKNNTNTSKEEYKKIQNQNELIEIFQDTLIEDQEYAKKYITVHIKTSVEHDLGKRIAKAIFLSGA